ncbi:MAG: hypothetical protein ABIN61_04400 [candidate division WOR-3 bacterium]
MLEIIISALILISPKDSTYLPFDITILFDPPLKEESILIYLDGKALPGEITSTYFFSEINNLPKGNHNITVKTEKESQEWSFFVMKKEEIPFIFTGSFSIGTQNYYCPDSSYYKPNGKIFGLDFSIYKDKNSLRASLYYDPEFQRVWAPFLSYSREKTYLEAGYISPYFDELTICSPKGLGFSGEISVDNLFILPLFLYIRNYDSLFSEYPRWLLGGKLSLKRNPFILGLTSFYGKDDTSNINRLIIVDPQESFLLGGELEMKIMEDFSLNVKTFFSIGNPNLYEDSTLKGKAFEGKINIERNQNRIEAGIRKVEDGYLTLGNSYLYSGRTSFFTNGVYQSKFLSTNFDYLAYEENKTIGFSISQIFKWDIKDLFSPIFEYQWAKFPEFYEEKYYYIGLGFESSFKTLHLENTFGQEKTISIKETESLRFLSNFIWYFRRHLLSFGLSAVRSREKTSFSLNLDGRLNLEEFGRLNINYYPYLEEGYKHHLLRIIYEYEF